MSGPKGLVASLVLGFGCVSAAQAQNVVPGGWSAQFNYQSLGAVSGAGGISNGFTPGWAGPSVAYSPYGVYQPMPQANFVAPGYVPPQRMVNSLGPFGDSIRRTTRPRRGR